jgi:hypothetical protein
MEIKPVMLLLALPFIMTGCELNSSQPTQPSQDFNNQLVRKINEYLKNQQIRYQCLANEQIYTINIDFFFTDNAENKKDNHNIQTASCTGNPGDNPNGLTQAKNVRNEVLEQGIAAIDANYSQYINDLNLGRATGNFVADVIELTTSGVIGALNGPASTLSALGVGLTTFRGARSSFDLNYFNKQTTAILVNRMNANRNEAYRLILVKKNQSIAEYSMAEAIKDIVAYYNAGTLISAFAELSKDAAIQSRISEAEVLRLQGVPVSPLATQPEVDIAIQVLNVLRQLAKDLKDESKKESATQKLQDIVAILEKSPEFKDLNFNSISSQEKDGKKILDGLIVIRENAANNLPKYTLFLDKIQTTIIKNGS